jgi:hypothetical protein
MHLMACQTVPGSRSMHSIQSVGHGNNVLLKARDYLCVCPVCEFGTEGICPSRRYASPWKLITLEPLTPTEAVQEPEELDETDWGVDRGSNDLVVELQVGDHFAIVADANDPVAQGQKFFILMYIKPMYVVEEERFIDTWKGVVEKDDEVVEGLYYHHQGLSENSYKLMGATGPARIYSDLVVAHKFAMTMANYTQKGWTAVYKLSKAARVKIEGALSDQEQMDALNSEDSGEGSNGDEEDAFSGDDNSDS